MTWHLPDTGVVIAKVWENDRFSIAVSDYLDNVPVKNQKILEEVYKEASRKFQKNIRLALMPLRDAAVQVATKNGIGVEDLTFQHIDEVISAVIANTGKSEGFYEKVRWQLNEMRQFDDVKNPFLTVFSESYDETTVWEIYTMRKVFSIRNVGKDCLSCQDPEESNLRNELITFLTAKSKFFNNKKSEGDLKIVSQMLAISGRRGNPDLIFLTVDRTLDEEFGKVMGPIIQDYDGQIGSVTSKLIR